MKLIIDESCPTAYLKPSPYNREESYPIFMVFDWENETIEIENRDFHYEGIPTRDHRGLVSYFLLPPMIDATKLRWWIEEDHGPLIAHILRETNITGEGHEATLTRTDEGEDLLGLLQFEISNMDEGMHHQGGLWSVDGWLKGCHIPEDISTENNLKIFVEEVTAEAKEENIVLNGDIGEYIKRRIEGEIE